MFVGTVYSGASHRQFPPPRFNESRRCKPMSSEGGILSDGAPMASRCCASLELGNSCPRRDVPSSACGNGRRRGWGRYNKHAWCGLVKKHRALPVERNETHRFIIKVEYPDHQSRHDQAGGDSLSSIHCSSSCRPCIAPFSFVYCALWMRLAGKWDNDVLLVLLCKKTETMPRFWS